MAIATFGAGCFWGVEHILRSLPRITDTEVGFMGGTLPAPTYEAVCEDTTGYIEVVQLTYDPHQISYDELLLVFWQLHDPTSLDNQGPYEQGSQYRAVVFYHTPEQAERAKASKVALEAANIYQAPIVTEIRPATTFWQAEEYHQEYIAKGGEHHCHVFTRTVTLPDQTRSDTIDAEQKRLAQ